MKFQKMQEYVNVNLNESDKLIDLFWGMQPAKIWLFALVGPFAAFSMKFYVVAVSEKGLYFHHVNFFEKFTDTAFFTYEEIENLSLKKGMLNTTVALRFDNGRKLKLKVAVKGKGAELSENGQEHLLQKFPVAA